MTINKIGIGVSLTGSVPPGRRGTRFFRKGEMWATHSLFEAAFREFAKKTPTNLYPELFANFKHMGIDYSDGSRCLSEGFKAGMQGLHGELDSDLLSSIKHRKGEFYRKDVVAGAAAKQEILLLIFYNYCDQKLNDLIKAEAGYKPSGFVAGLYEDHGNISEDPYDNTLSEIAHKSRTPKAYAPYGHGYASKYEEGVYRRRELEAQVLNNIQSGEQINENMMAQSIRNKA